jgi:hypothetical protein
MDRIAGLRADIARHIDFEAPIPGGHEESLSPSGRYRMSFDAFGVKNTDRNWDVACIQITCVLTSTVLHSYTRGDSRCFYAWVRKGDDEFLLLAEDLEGQSVYSPTLLRFGSVAPEEETFIWCSFHPSPSGRYIAIEGCYWACPYMTIIYDFADPFSLPLPKVLECCESHNVDFDQWLSDDTFRLKTSFRGELTHTIP